MRLLLTVKPGIGIQIEVVQITGAPVYHQCRHRCRLRLQLAISLVVAFAVLLLPLIYKKTKQFLQLFLMAQYPLPLVWALHVGHRLYAMHLVDFDRWLPRLHISFRYFGR